MKNNIQSILKFNLDTSEGRDAHFRACKADQAYRALHEIEQLLRKYDKYGIDELDATIVIGRIRKEVSELILDNDINLMEEYK